MKKSNVAVVAAWLVAGAAAVFLGHVMTQEPTAAAAPAPRTGTTTVEHVQAPEKAPVELPETVIVVKKNAPKKAQTATAKTGGCWTHELRQGGSPTAPTVLVCD